MDRKKTILDDMLECIRQETSSVGTVYVRKQERQFLFGNTEKKPQSALQRPSVPPQTPAPQVKAPEPPPKRTVPLTQRPPIPDLSGKTLEELRQCVQQCSSCILADTRKHTVFSDGDPHARLMFIGEGPGADEDEQGVPFVGAAGQLLTKMIRAMTLDRKDVYIANVVKCRPPGNRNPEDAEALVCLPYLRKQIELVKPEAIVLLGAVPLKYLMERTGITRLRGTWLKYGEIPVMPTFHPAYLLRNVSAKKEVWQDLQQVMERLGLHRN